MPQRLKKLTKRGMGARLNFMALNAAQSTKRMMQGKPASLATPATISPTVRADPLPHGDKPVGHPEAVEPWMDDMSENGLFGELFLSVGAMKAGTTWLYAVLDRHPELHFTPEKEIHYFYHKYINQRQLSDERRLQLAKTRYIDRIDPAKANIDRVKTNLHWVSNYLTRRVDDFWYRNLFTLQSPQRYACDFSNLHAHLPPEAWRQIHDNCTTLRVMYTMRDPIKRLWSHTKFHLQMTGQVEALDTWSPAEFNAFVRQPFIWDNAEYGKVVQRLQASLPPETVLLNYYEDIHADQRAALAKIEDFLGLPHFNYPEPVLNRRMTESVARPMPDFFPGLFADDIARIAGELREAGLELPQSWSL